MLRWIPLAVSCSLFACVVGGTAVVATRPTGGPPPQQVQVATTPGGAAPVEADPNAVMSLALGEGHTCTLSGAGQIRCWGNNRYRTLGLGSNELFADGIVTGIPDRVTAIAAGGFQTCALTALGHVWCWGFNNVGQAGDGNASDSAVAKPTRVARLDRVRSLHLSDKTSCALTTDGKLHCWGDNTTRQITDSSSRMITSPTHVRALDGAELVAAGNYHICVATAGRVRCTGELAKLNGDLAAFTNVTALSSGWGHSCMINDGKVYCFGKNYLGILGIPNTCGKDGECLSVLRPPVAVEGISGIPQQLRTHTYFTCALSTTNTVTCWGNNQAHGFSDELPAEPYQLAHVATGVTADAIFVGGIHWCTLRAGAVACRGNDGAGAIRGAPARR